MGRLQKSTQFGVLNVKNGIKNQLVIKLVLKKRLRKTVGERRKKMVGFAQITSKSKF
ncbi:MAG TPA: hypothetical protein VJ824_13015 [Bacillota bacterium]|nr:hypothetical protein [Bacillota bacterium]